MNKDLVGTAKFLKKIQKGTGSHTVSIEYMIYYHRREFKIKCTKVINGELIVYNLMIPAYEIELAEHDNDDFYIKKANEFFEWSAEESQN